MLNRFEPLQTGVVHTKAWLIIFSLQATTSGGSAYKRLSV